MRVPYCYLNQNHPYYSKSKKDFQTKKLAAFLKIELAILPVVLVVFFFLLSPFKESSRQVLGAVVENTPIASPSATSIISLSPSPTPTIVPTATPTAAPTIPPPPLLRKNSYSIAVFGDSMVDTMGERLEYLEHSLKRKYPNVNFTLYNFGKGSENVEMGLARLNSRLDYQDRHYPSIVEVKPDIVIVGSFAYNPFSPYDRDRHWIGLTKLVQQVQTVSPNVYMLAEIAPLRSNFGKGPMGVNYDTDTAFTHSGRIVEQLENAVGLSKTLGVPLIDVFDASKGHPEYTNPSDGIHPSVSGHEFTADIIANTIQLN